MLQGIFTALITPYKNNDCKTIDFALLNGHVQRQVENGVNGFLLFSIAGEGRLLSQIERNEILNSVQKIIDSTQKNLNLIADCTADAVDDFLIKANGAFNGKATHILIAVPPGMPLSNRAIFNYFINFANVSPLPLIVLNNTPQTGHTLLPEDIVRLGEHENIIAYCEGDSSSAGIIRAKSLLNGKMDFISFNDQNILSMSAAGCSAFISNGSNALLKKYKDLYSAIQNGNISASQKIQSDLSGFHEALLLEPGPGSIKASLNLLGFCNTCIRTPFEWPLRPVLYRLAAELDKLGLSIKSGELS
ncbi:MAG: dihydrodipicolinate synthase family protein [Deltaproteobacteria bacterium]|nr:dihydrodipicolinate synthase family protein [Deltaproteobacteria bacterium]